MNEKQSPDEFAKGIDLPNTAPQLLYRVRGGGKYAVLYARDKGHARERFATEFFPGVDAERCEAI